MTIMALVLAGCRCILHCSIWKLIKSEAATGGMLLRRHICDPFRISVLLPDRRDIAASFHYFLNTIEVLSCTSR